MKKNILLSVLSITMILNTTAFAADVVNSNYTLRTEVYQSDICKVTLEKTNFEIISATIETPMNVELTTNHFSNLISSIKAFPEGGQHDYKIIGTYSKITFFGEKTVARSDGGYLATTIADKEDVRSGIANYLIHPQKNEDGTFGLNFNKMSFSGNFRTAEGSVWIRNCDNLTLVVQQ